MGCVIYREGNTHTERGIECEILTTTNKRVLGYLSAGWFASPEEMVESRKPKKTTRKKKVAPKEEG